MGALERIAAARHPAGTEQRFTADTWLSEFMLPSLFGYGGTQYGYGGVQTTYGANRVQQITQTLPGHLAALRLCPPAFAAEMVRATVLSQARFTFRRLAASSQRTTFGTKDLAILEHPWVNGTTGDLLSLMEWHAGLAGNAFVCRQPTRLRVLRPDWTGVLYGSQLEPDDPMLALDAEVVGYVYANRGLAAANRTTIRTLLPAEVAHWAPIPDPEWPGIGMSWLTPALRDMQADMVATQHKLTFFSNGATPNMVVTGIPAATKEQFDTIVELLEGKHAGAANAYRTLYLTAGADAKVVGSNLKDIDLKNVQGASETRISFLSRVPAPLLGISEGLAGASLNAGNFAASRRTFGDTWVWPALQGLAGALAPLVSVPSDAELWPDTSDIPLLREDAKDAAEIGAVQASTIENLVRAGFTAESAVVAVTAQNMRLLVHTGLVSVQLQVPGAAPPGSTPPPDATPAPTSKPKPATPPPGGTP